MAPEKDPKWDPNRDPKWDPKGPQSKIGSHLVSTWSPYLGPTWGAIWCPFLGPGETSSYGYPLCNGTLSDEAPEQVELATDRLLFPVAISTSLLNESCGGDVEDETLPGLADNPGTTRGTKLSVLQIMLFPSLVNRGF